MFGKNLFIFCGLFCCVNFFVNTVEALEVISQWSFVEYDAPSFDYDVTRAIRPENNVLTGLEITEDRIFLATPRLRSGVGPTISTIPRATIPGSSPILKAYPDWSWHAANVRGNYTCSGLISVYRLRKDSCNRLWVMDSGITTSIEDFRVVCPPKIVIFDLLNNQPVRIVQFPREVIRPNTLTTNLVIDEVSRGKCDHAFVYISDTTNPGLIVYDAAKDSAWRFLHPTMFPDPDFGATTIAGETFTLMDGIVGLAMSPLAGVLYYQPLATNRVFSVPLSVLTKGPLADNEELPVSLVGQKSSQGLALAVDPLTDDLIFSPMTETSVAAWNPKTNVQSVLAYDPELLQFAAELRVVESDDYNIWVLTTRFQKFFRRTVSPHEINLRVLRIPKVRAASIPYIHPHSHALSNSILL